MISHLLFSYDCFLFFRATDQESHVMKSTLATYGAASGQKVNYGKSEVYFSRNMLVDTKHSIVASLGVCITMGIGRYLGLPSMVGRASPMVRQPKPLF